ncbi:MAG: exopolysaccharide biosynthesis protein [Erythrobacter sp.]|nr:exopolysaccharide biosynthesis protein [Erythrobacter sp.]NCQ62799.1 exopolysaccharide biosynthesis protein [Alphaproteobacteria bacterium]
MADTPKNVCGILDSLTEIGDQQDRVSIGDIVEAFGSRSYGPVLLVPALIGISPIGGIPGVPTFLAVTLLLIAVQLVFGKDHLWLPGILKNRSVEGEKLANAAEDMEGVAKWMDKIFHGRLEIFTGPTAGRIAAGVIALLCFAVPPLEFLPFAVVLPMAVIAAFGIALTVRDGLLMLVAFLGSGGAFYLLVTQVLMGGGGSGGGSGGMF